MFPATSCADLSWWTVLFPNPVAIVEDVGGRAGMSALDLCCGSGHFTHALARVAGPRGKVFALDLIPELVETAVQAVRAEKCDADHASVVGVVGNADDVSTLMPEKVDFVLLANTLHGVPDQTRLLTGAAEVLKPDGILVILYITL